jgi:glycosyltransferase involved in cell wall biosynthesis
MDILDKLAGVGVKPTTDPASIASGLHVHDNVDRYRTRRQRISLGKISPLVSCLMVTRGDRRSVKYALECYRRQTYENRELIIAVDRANLAAVSALVRAANIDGVTLTAVDADLTLGDCRNMSVARARGEILMQWDDDDLYDPLRIAVCVSALTKAAAAAALLSRWLVWWPARELAAVSGRRLWEGSIAVWREHALAYPSVARGEDTFVTECIAKSCAITTIDAPLLYVYVVNGSNTFDTKHHEDIVARADYVARDGEYTDLIRLLSERLPILEYQMDLADPLQAIDRAGAGQPNHSR